MPTFHHPQVNTEGNKGGCSTRCTPKFLSYIYILTTLRSPQNHNMKEGIFLPRCVVSTQEEGASFCIASLFNFSTQLGGICLLVVPFLFGPQTPDGMWMRRRGYVSISILFVYILTTHPSLETGIHPSPPTSLRNATRKGWPSNHHCPLKTPKMSMMRLSQGADCSCTAALFAMIGWGQRFSSACDIPTLVIFTKC